MSHSDSYDMAFKLSRILNLHKKKFCNNDSLIIYPSSWYDGFFELMFRDKNDPNEPIKIESKIILYEVVNRFLEEGWSFTSVDYTTAPFDRCMETPLKMQFER